MKRYVNSASISIVVGITLGIIAGVTLIETQPPILGWLFGLGMGLMGGAFIAAITSGSALVGGSSGGRSRSGRSAAPWLDQDESSKD